MPQNTSIILTFSCLFTFFCLFILCSSCSVFTSHITAQEIENLHQQIKTEKYDEIYDASSPELQRCFAALEHTFGAPGEITHRTRNDFTTKEEFVAEMKKLAGRLQAIDASLDLTKAAEISFGGFLSGGRQKASDPLWEDQGFFKKNGETVFSESVLWKNDHGKALLLNLIYFNQKEQKSFGIAACD